MTRQQPDDERRRAPRPEPQRITLDERIAAQPEPIREELEALREHEPTVLAALQRDPKLHARFLQEPGAVLAELKVPLSPQLRRRLAASATAAPPRTPTFVMPDGRTFTPKVNVRIVKGV